MTVVDTDNNRIRSAIRRGLSGLFTLGWMCALKREQARREWESELQHVNILHTLL